MRLSELESSHVMCLVSFFATLRRGWMAGEGEGHAERMKCGGCMDVIHVTPPRLKLSNYSIAVVEAARIEDS